MGRRPQHAVAPSAENADGQGGFTDYQKLALREFRYHPNPRGRFMARDLDPNDPQEEWSTVGAEHWTDYDIPMPNGDFDVTFDLQGDPVETEQMRYLQGFGLPAQQTVATGATQYLHGDLIRSTMLTTGQGGTAVSAVSYTAFGEFIGSAPETRYQYGGGWGYESDLLVLEGAPGTAPILLQHVGFRWYQPSSGRFLQRDPIAVSGGLNVYLYCGANPLVVADPQGLQPTHPKFCPYCGTTFRHRPGCPYYVPRPPRAPGPPRKLPGWGFWRFKPGVGDKGQHMGTVVAGLGGTAAVWGWRTKRPKVTFAGGIIAGAGGSLILIGGAVEIVEDWIWGPDP